MRGEALFAGRGVVDRDGEIGEVLNLQLGRAIDGQLLKVGERDGEQASVVTAVGLLDQVGGRANAFEQRGSVRVEHAIPPAGPDRFAALYEEQISGEGFDLQGAGGAEVSEAFAFTLPRAFLEKPIHSTQGPRADHRLLKKSGTQRRNGFVPCAGHLEIGVEAGEIVLLVDGEGGADRIRNLGMLLPAVFFVNGYGEEKIAPGRGGEEEERTGQPEALLDGETRTKADEIMTDMGDDDAVAEGPGEGSDIVGDDPVLDEKEMAVGAGDEYATDAAQVGGPGVAVGRAWHEHVPGEGEEELVFTEEMDARAVVETKNALHRTRLITELGEWQGPERVRVAGLGDRGQ